MVHIMIHCHLFKKVQNFIRFYKRMLTIESIETPARVQRSSSSLEGNSLLQKYACSFLIEIRALCKLVALLCPNFVGAQKKRCPKSK